MSAPLPDPSSLPSTSRLLKATAAAAIAAGLVLVVAVLPAEYGIDPTGLGARLGLDVLAPKASAAEPAPPVAAPAKPAPMDERTQLEARKSAEVFGEEPGQSFDLAAVGRATGAPRTDTYSVTIAPGKGAEVKAQLKQDDGFTFHWTADGEVAVDMHGDRPDAKDAYTSYWIEGAQREGAGTFIAPFEGKHGWYWRNRGQQPVTVQITVTGHQQNLFRPGHP
jgi:hypothetical protein